MHWFFGLIAIIQIILWIYFILNKKYLALITTGLLGVFSIWSYLNAYIKYIYNDPCYGIEGCMNETGMIFVILTILILISTLVSLFVFIIERYNINNSNKQI
jgi:hypothetical protein